MVGGPPPPKNRPPADHVEPPGPPDDLQGPQPKKKAKLPQPSCPPSSKASTEEGKRFARPKSPLIPPKAKQMAQTQSSQPSVIPARDGYPAASLPLPKPMDRPQPAPGGGHRHNPSQDVREAWRAKLKLQAAEFQLQIDKIKSEKEVALQECQHQVDKINSEKQVALQEASGWKARCDDQTMILNRTVQSLLQVQTECNEQGAKVVDLGQKLLFEQQHGKGLAETNAKLQQELEQLKTRFVQLEAAYMTMQRDKTSFYQENVGMRKLVDEKDRRIRQLETDLFEEQGRVRQLEMGARPRS